MAVNNSLHKDMLIVIDNQISMLEETLKEAATGQTVVSPAMQIAHWMEVWKAVRVAVVEKYGDAVTKNKKGAFIGGTR